MQSPSQEPPASCKAQNQDLKDTDVPCTFKIKIERQNLEYGLTKYLWPYPNQYQGAKFQSGTSSVFQSPKSAQALKDMDVLHTFKIEIESKNFEYKYIKDQWQYLNQGQDISPQSETSGPHQSP